MKTQRATPARDIKSSFRRLFSNRRDLTPYATVTVTPISSRAIVPVKLAYDQELRRSIITAKTDCGSVVVFADPDGARGDRWHRVWLALGEVILALHEDGTVEFGPLGDKTFTPVKEGR